MVLYRLEQAEDQIRALREREQKLEAKIEAREQERAAEERRRLVAGIMFLGGVIMSLVGIIWTFRSDILGGKP